MQNKNWLIAAMICMSACSTPTGWHPLFNGKDLAGWDTYLGPVYDSLAQRFDSTRVPGLNQDRAQVFRVVEVDGQPAIRISGEAFGGVSTAQELKNFHLQLQFKWGIKKSNPRKDKKRDSGVLYHAGGPHGADAGFWMRSQEFQVQEGDCGDYWGVAGGSFEVPVSVRGEGYIYDPAGKRMTFNEKSSLGRQVIKMPDSELPTGQWNTIDLYCLGDTTVHMMNGQVNMILYHSSRWHDGKLIPLREGKIQLQSEGAEVYYRQIRWEPITKIADAILHHKYDPTSGMEFD